MDDGGEPGYTRGSAGSADGGSDPFLSLSGGQVTGEPRSARHTGILCRCDVGTGGTPPSDNARLRCAHLPVSGPRRVFPAFAAIAIPSAGGARALYKRQGESGVETADTTGHRQP